VIRTDKLRAAVRYSCILLQQASSSEGISITTPALSSSGWLAGWAFL